MTYDSHTGKGFPSELHGGCGRTGVTASCLKLWKSPLCNLSVVVYPKTTVISLSKEKGVEHCVEKSGEMTELPIQTQLNSSATVADLSRLCEMMSRP